MDRQEFSRSWVRPQSCRPRFAKKGNGEALQSELRDGPSIPPAVPGEAEAESAWYY